MRIDVLHAGMLTIGNLSSFMNQFDVFFINPYGLQWRGFSCKKSGRCSIQDMEVVCGLENPFSSNNELISSFHTWGMGLLCGFWLLGKNDVARFESDILRMKCDVVSL